MSNWKTLHVHRDDRGVVTVELDTPSSEVNILTGQVVGEIFELLDTLDAAEVSALVFTSAKRRSFINGAQLMLASAVQSPESIVDLTELLRRTYRAVAEFEAPTIAAVRGSCYGCGVEFSLCCDYRIARDGADTTFYMTEVADYLNGPAFGSTQRLPRMLGLEHAVGFLLWGHRLWGERAHRAGLVSRVLEPSRFDDEVHSFVGEVLAGNVSPAALVREAPEEIDRVRQATLDEIERLPLAYRSLFKDCLALMVHSATKPGELADEDFERELAVAGETLVKPQAEAARSFLYLRQLAERVWVRDIPQRRHLWLTASPSDPSAISFAAALDRRRVPGVRIGARDQTQLEGHTEITLVGRPSQAAPAADEPQRVGVCLGPTGTEPSPSAPLVVRRPFAHAATEHWETRIPATGTRPLVELALIGDDRDLVAPLFEYLDAAGHSVIVSTPADAFAADTFCAAFAAPLVAYVAAGGDADVAHTSLKRFGFVPCALAELAGEDDHDALVAAVSARLPEPLRPQAPDALGNLLNGSDRAATSAPELVDAVVLSLLHATRAALADGLLRHSTLADVICRELLGFPVGHASLCEYATVATVADALEDDEMLGQWLPNAVLDDARAFVDEGRNFYL